MPEDFHEEETIGKAYDAKLMRRLISYARPYWRSLLGAMLMLTVITGAELARPYIIKVAIDDHILALNRPMLAYPLALAPQPGTIYRGMVFLRAAAKYTQAGGTPYQILSWRKSYFLVRGVAIDPEKTRYSIQQQSGRSVATIGGQQYQAQAMDRKLLSLFRREDNRALFRLCLLFLLIILVGFALNYAQTIVLQFTSQRIIHTIRREVFAHLQSMSLSFFDKNPVGRLVTRVTNDTDTLNEMYASVLVNLFRDIFMLFGVTLIMIRLSPRLALISLSVLPLIFASTVVFRRYAREAYRNVRTALARINAFIAENIMGMRVVQIFGQEKKKYGEFLAINQRYFDASMRELYIFAIFRPIMDLLFWLAMALLVWYGGRQVLAGAVTFGLVFAFVNYIGQFFQPIMELTEKYNILQASMASSERVFLLLDTKPEVENPPQPVPDIRLRGRIEFRHVWFAYVGEDWVLRDVSLTIEPGQTVAFVGATGAGKTSIISLIARFYDVQRGEILIDGVNIREYDLGHLRRSIAPVLQDVFLFTGDIASNIRLNNAKISDEQIRIAAAYVNADLFIRNLPGGYAEPVAERGATLSTGQRQLLAFARALAFNPAILVLDEATANIDTETEVLIQEALARLVKGRTTIVVAHRLSTIQHADRIIVLHKGKVRESGTHQELLAGRGIYYDLYRLQYTG